MCSPLAIKSCSLPCPHLPHSDLHPALQISTFVHFLFIFSVVLERVALNIKCAIIVIRGEGAGAEHGVICTGGPHFLQANLPHYCSSILSFIHLLDLCLLSVAGLKTRPEWPPRETLRHIGGPSGSILSPGTLSLLR